MIADDDHAISCNLLENYLNTESQSGTVNNFYVGAVTVARRLFNFT